ncbi:MAG: SLC13 family permease [Bacteroidia bacterium]|nr:SLC13 family permease [Bacteroidia bacterium]MDW8236626.1 SLC13 family permease [Bacteroidia bacterium]
MRAVYGLLTAGLLAGIAYFSGWTKAEAIGIGVFVVMAVWWITEAVPFYITALLPLLSIPLLEKVSAINAAVLWQSYGSSVIGLFLGSFWLARAVEKHGVALFLRNWVIGRAKGKPALIIGGLMGVSALLSAFLNNTAVAALLLTAVRQLFPPGVSRWRGGLAVVWAASLGGVLVPIGSAPNAITIELLESHGYKVSFLQWMFYGVPVTLVGLVGAYILLQSGEKLTILSSPTSVSATLHASGKVVMGLLGAMLMAWLLLPVPPWVVALVGAIFLFLPILPQGALLTLEEGNRIPWSILWLFGGGLALSRLMELTGLSRRLTDSLVPLLGYIPPTLWLMLIVGATLWLTELFSNTALCSLALPIFLPVLEKLPVSPYQAIWIGIATSMAFMLPVATPPNALAYTLAEIPLPYMRTRGLWLNFFMMGWIWGLILLYDLK